MKTSTDWTSFLLQSPTDCWHHSILCQHQYLISKQIINTALSEAVCWPCVNRVMIMCTQTWVVSCSDLTVVTHCPVGSGSVCHCSWSSAPARGWCRRTTRHCRDERTAPRRPSVDTSQGTQPAGCWEDSAMSGQVPTSLPATTTCGVYQLLPEKENQRGNWLAPCKWLSRWCMCIKFKGKGVILHWRVDRVLISEPAIRLRADLRRVLNVSNNNNNNNNNLTEPVGGYTTKARFPLHELSYLLTQLNNQ